MVRDVAQLRGQTFDVLIIGGGIYGLTIAADAAQRGLTVALVEANDFGSGNSFNHLRTIHGGLRYLQTLDLRRARESIRERRTLARIAPAALRPLPFVLPLRPQWMKGASALRVGLALDRMVARDRNAGLPAALQLPPGQVLSAAAVRARYPLAAAGAPLGAAVWYDYLLTDADRLTLSWARAAARDGAVLANYVEASGLLLEARRVHGAEVLDRLGGASFEIAARTVINAAGPRIDSLLAPAGIGTATQMLRAINLVTRLPGGDAAIGGFTRSGRALFMVPWRGRALFGTWESSALCDADAGAKVGGDVDEFLWEIPRAFPDLQLTRDEVTLVHRGVVPAAVSAAGAIGLEGRQRLFDHAVTGGVQGLVSVAGTKYTTARAVAEQIVDLVITKLGRAPVASRTAVTPLPLETPAQDVDPLVAAREEMAMTLSDVVIRRTGIGALGHPGAAVVEAIAATVAPVLGWDETRRAREIQQLNAFYAF